MKNISYLEIWFAVLIGLTINAYMIEYHVGSAFSFFLFMFAPIGLGIILTITKAVYGIRLKKHTQIRKDGIYD